MSTTPWGHLSAPWTVEKLAELRVIGRLVGVTAFEFSERRSAAVQILNGDSRRADTFLFLPQDGAVRWLLNGTWQIRPSAILLRATLIGERKIVWAK